MASVFVRDIRIGDGQRCAELHAASFAHPWAATDFCAQIASADRAGSVVVKGSQILGFVLSRVVADEADILTIVVDRTARHTGLGTELLRHHFARLSTLKTARVHLEVDENNDAAIKLYKKMRFVPLGTRTGYYPARDGRASNALAMGCKL